MQTNQIENTLKKMGLVLEKLVQKVDELDKRVAKLENGETDEKKFSAADFQKTQTQSSTSKSLSSGFGSSFLGSMTGAVAGMGLYNLLFNHSVSPVEMGHDMGMNDQEIDNILQNDINDMDTKLDEIDTKLDELDSKIDTMADNDIMNSDYFENYDEEDIDSGNFGGGFDDFDGYDDV